MNIDAKCNCPVCKQPAKLIRFKARVGEMVELEYICRKCHIFFSARALQLHIQKGQVTFTDISGPIEVTWKDKDFNPSER